MLLRAAVIYVLAVGILLLGGAVAVQRIQIATVNGDRAAAENLGDELRKQVDRLRSEKADLERLIRVGRVSAGEDKLKHDAAEQLARQLHDQLDALTAASQFTDPARKAADTKLTPPSDDKVALETALVEVRKDLERARQATEAAEKEADELRQQVLGLSARIATLTPPVDVGAPAKPDSPKPAAPAVSVHDDGDQAGAAAHASIADQPKKPAPEITGALPETASQPTQIKSEALEAKPEKPVAKAERRHAPAKHAGQAKRESPRRAQRAAGNSSSEPPASSGSGELFSPF